jgi:hypothetical protein|tara:strand:+ start:5918 stop:6499 length:582 start_codon:yes stop_codon:yes gene_type:complete
VKKCFFDFGCGDIGHQLKDAKLNEFYTVGIDTRKYEAWYSVYWNLYVNESLCGKFSEIKTDLRADEWASVSCFEHLKQDDILSEISALVALLKKDSVGYLHINLSDHSVTPSLEHIRNDTPTSGIPFDPLRPASYFGKFGHYLSDKHAHHINTVSKEEWIKIISQFFTYDTYIERHNKLGVHVIEFYELRLKE